MRARCAPSLSEALGVVRERAGLETAVARLEPLAFRGGAVADPALVALLIATAALRARGEPRRPLARRLPASFARLGAPPRAACRRNRHAASICRAVAAAEPLAIPRPSEPDHDPSHPFPLLMLEACRACRAAGRSRPRRRSHHRLRSCRRRRAETALVARQPGIVAGLDAASLAFRLVDPAIEVRIERPDGSGVQPGDRIAVIAGPARGMLTAERVALNFLGHLSGVATATAHARRGSAGPQGAHLLHAQDHARPARLAEIRRARRRRRQSPLRPRRRRADQGQPCRRGGRRGGGDPRRARRRRPPGQDRGRDRSRSTSSTRRWRRRPTPCCSTIWAPSQLAEAVRRIAGRAIAEASGRITPATAPAIAAERRRPDLGRLADPQRPGARYRTGLAAAWAGPQSRGASHRGVKAAIRSG